MYRMTRDQQGAPGVKTGKNGSDLLGANTEIGRKLKQYYDELVSDEVPDRFAQLLSQLEKAAPSQKKD
jgi:Anti-sigma factor NepR